MYQIFSYSNIFIHLFLHLTIGNPFSIICFPTGRVFNPSTTLNLDLSNDGFVSVQIYNVVGQVVATLVNGQMNAGYHRLTWDASNIASGIYFVKVEAGSNVATQKLMLMK